MKHLLKFARPAIFVVMLLIPPNANSCGPFFSDAIFTFDTHPAAPLKQYAEGDLGVILPSFARSYLVVAYRHLSGRPLTRSEAAGALKYWVWKLKGGWTDGPNDPAREWAEERTRIMRDDLPASLARFRKMVGKSYNVETSCQEDAFHTAAKTLKDRVRRVGPKSMDIREWVHGQDLVFSNCYDQPSIPKMLEDSRPAWLRADRRYQIAAAHFHAGDLTLAIQEFDQIAQDRQSPWHVIAPYLAARIIVRRGSARADETDFLKDARERLTAILHDKSRASVHLPAQKMLGLIAYRLDPDKRIHELARVLAGPHPDANFEQDLIDYTFGLDRWAGEEPLFWEPGDTEEKAKARELGWKQKRFFQLGRFALNEEMTDWIFTMQQAGGAGQNRALKGWRDHHSLPWLVAAISKIDASDKIAAELSHAAERVEINSPGYPTVFYHRIRLLLQAGETERARMLLDEMLPDLERKISRSSFNLFLQQRLKLATSFEDLLHYAPRLSVGQGGEESDIADDWVGCGWHKSCEVLVYTSKRTAKLEARFDMDAAFIFNTRLPLDLIASAGLDEKLPPPLRGELALSTWTRATMLGRHDIAEALIPESEKAYPVMKADLERYRSADTPEDRWHTALLAILHFPGARPYLNSGSSRNTAIQRIDSYRDNWWCSDVGLEANRRNYEKDYDKARPKEHSDAPGYPRFLSTEQVEAAKSEWQKLFAIGTAADYLPEETLKWAKEQPHDPRIPEALHYAVRATRYGCGGLRTSSLSRQAFKLLHSRYPRSKWARETPFWF